MQAKMPALPCLLCLALLQACGGGGGSSSGGGDGGAAPLPPAEFELQAGAAMDFAYGAQAGDVYAVSMRQASCSGGICCSLTATGGGLAGAANILHETAPNPATGMARMLLEPPDGGQITLTVSALNQCRFDTPTLSPAADVATAREQVRASGQKPIFLSVAAQNFDLDVTRVGNRIFLYGTSRRGEGGLAEDAHFSTVRFQPNTASREDYRFAIHQAADAASLDKSAVDAHGYTQAVHQYLKTALNFDSYDRQGAAMVAVTHLDFPIVPRTFCGELRQPGTLWNAFWNRQAKVIAFTDAFPDSGRPLPASVALDVVAHEWGHAVTNEFTNLRYERESGALNEAFSDWIAAAVEHHYRSDDTFDVCYTDGTCLPAIWLVGEDASPIRSMSSPNFYDDPDTYKGKFWQPTDMTSCPTPDICENDYCGVHSNSGVGNKMFYLLSEGGTFNGVTVTGIGVQVAMEIAIIAHRDHWSKMSTYKAARNGMVNAAEDYDTANSTSTKAQVENAWKAVGVE